MNTPTTKPYKTPGQSSALLAFSGNLLITFLKFIGYAISTSPSLFSEAVHSLADTANQGLLLLGIKLSKRKADEKFSYGYGAERFFWAVISACGIFFLGAGVTVYHGITSLQENHHTEITIIVYVILFVSFIVEGFTLYKAYKEISHLNKKDSFVEALKKADPVTAAVFYEDLVAVVGVFIAGISIYLSKVTGISSFDSAGSIVVGLLLALVAVLLIKKNREFILGKSIPSDMKDEIIEILMEDPHIDKVIDFRSEVLDIGKYHIKCEIEFNGSALLGEITKGDSLQEEFDEIDGNYEEFVKFIIYHTGRIPRIIGKRIDGIEAKIKSEFPQVEYIDLEIN